MDHRPPPRSATRTARPPDLMTALFALAAALLLLFILLPLLSIALNTSRHGLVATITDPEVLASLVLTLATGAIATLLALLLGLPLAYLLARREFPGKAVVEGIIDVPVVIPHTAAGVALLLVFGRFGAVGQFTTPLGLSFTGTAAGIVVAMLFVSVPFLVNNAREAFALIEPEMESVALTEGASRWQSFRHVTLPLAGQGVLAGALMTWARAMSEFGAVVILAYNPKIVPVLIYERFAGFGLQAAQPLALLMIVATLVIFILLRGLMRRQRAMSSPG